MVRVIAIILALACVALALAYWLVPAGSLPTFIPGYIPGGTQTHLKHGIAAIVLAILLFIIGWFAGRSRSGGSAV